MSGVNVKKQISKIGYMIVWAMLVVILVYMLFFVAKNRGLFTSLVNSRQDNVYSMSGRELDNFVSVEDGWEYYPGEFIGGSLDGSETPSGYVNINTGITDTGERIESSDASFALYICDISEDIALLLPGDSDQYRVYINGEPVTSDIDYELITRSIYYLEAGQDYEIIIESEGYIPAQEFQPTVISKEEMEYRMELSRIIMMITLGICIFSIASVLIICLSSVKKERLFSSAIFAMTVFSSVWYACYTNKYLDTIQTIFPNISDTGIVWILDICMSLCLIINNYLLIPQMTEFWNVRMIRKTPFFTSAVLAAALVLSRVIDLSYFKITVVIVSMILLLLTLVMLMMKIVRNRTENYFQLCSFAMIPFAFGIAMMFNKNLMDLNYMYLVSGMVIAYDFLVFISIMVRNALIRRKLEEAAAAQDKLLHLQGAFWASQIQPHFIYNTLQAIQSLCISDPEKAMELTGRFSSHLRHSVDYINMTQLIPFEDELAHVNNYVEIQQVRFGEALKYEQNIETDDFMIPPLTLQPLVENAIKYGVRNRTNGGTVRIEVAGRKDGIHITVTDDGPGFDSAKIKENGGIENVRNRLTAYLDAELRYYSGSSGTKAEIFIPAREVRKVENGSDG